MQTKLSGNSVATIDEFNGILVIRTGGKAVAEVALDDEDFDKIRILIEKYLDRFKSSEVQDLFNMVNRLAFAMKEKLEQKSLEGYDGWDNPDLRNELLIKMLEHLKRGDMLDAINFAAFVWNMEEDK
jgi:hypothetical protein